MYMDHNMYTSLDVHIYITTNYVLCAGPWDTSWQVCVPSSGECSLWLDSSTPLHTAFTDICRKKLKLERHHRPINLVLFNYLLHCRYSWTWKDYTEKGTVITELFISVHWDFVLNNPYLYIFVHIHSLISKMDDIHGWGNEILRTIVQSTNFNV